MRSPQTATGYTERLASYERGLGRLLWVGLLATLVWLGT
jgi:hypothetical protein